MAVPLADELTAEAVELEQLATDAERAGIPAVFPPVRLRAIARLLRTGADVVQVGHDHPSPGPGPDVHVEMGSAPTFCDGYAAGLADGRHDGRR